MAIFDNMTIDNRLNNIAISTNDTASLHKKVFENPIRVDSIYSWYPFFDENAYTDVDDRKKFRKGPKTTPKEVAFEYSKKEVMINGYQAYSFRSRQELEELSAASISNVEEDMTRGLVRKLNNMVDFDLLDNIQSTSNWYNQAVIAVWTDQTNGDPEGDLRNLREDIIIQSRGNFVPNTLIIPTHALSLLLMHAKVKSRFDNVYGTEVDKVNSFLNMLGITKLIEVTKTVNSAKKGATPSNSAYMGSKLWMGYIDPNPSVNAPTALAPIVPTSMVGNDEGVAISKMVKMNGDQFENGTEGIKVFGTQFTEIVQISKDLGKVLTGIHA